MQMFSCCSTLFFSKMYIKQTEFLSFTPKPTPPQSGKLCQAKLVKMQISI